MDARLLARLLACGRVGIGLGLFAAPRTAARLWLGEDVGPRAAVLARGLGVRDLAIGVGQLVTLDEMDDPAPWLDAGIAADAADATAALLARRDLPPSAMMATVAVAAGAALTGLALKRALATP